VCETWRTLLLILTILGALATVWGVVGGYYAAKREVRKAEERNDKMRTLLDQESEHRVRFQAERGMDLIPIPADFREFLDAPPEVAGPSEERFAEAGLTRPTLSRIELLSMQESVRLLRIILDSARGNLITAGLGLVLATVASAWSLYLE